MISDTQLIQWNREGLIPGPGEDEESFQKRVEYCLKLKENIDDILPFKPEEKASETTISTHFDIAPTWLPVYFSNYQLSPWHGGCAWIFQVDEHSPTAALLQLRKQFKDKKNYLGIYSRDELIAHELTHVGRMTFQEPKFEEFHAYRTSPSRFRKWMGPLFRSSREALFFIMVLIAVLFVNLTMNIPWINGIPFILIMAAFLRLWWNQREYVKCLNNLEKIFSGSAQAVIYRLTDSEIEQFSRMGTEEIRRYIDDQSSLRWRVIVAAYPFNTTEYTEIT